MGMFYATPREQHEFVSETFRMPERLPGRDRQ